MSNLKSEEKDTTTELEDKNLDEIAGGSNVSRPAQISAAGLGNPAGGTKDVYLTTPTK